VGSKVCISGKVIDSEGPTEIVAEHPKQIRAETEKWFRPRMHALAGTLLVIA
jgi:hypothetical protein